MWLAHIHGGLVLILGESLVERLVELAGPLLVVESGVIHLLLSPALHGLGLLPVHEVVC